jgi:DNA-directed RNA polymerase specialized sigma24 family protein
MEDVTELISKVSQELGSNASDEEIREKVLKAIEALPESDRAQVLEQLVKGVSSGQLRHLDKEVDAERQADGGNSVPNTEPAP